MNKDTNTFKIAIWGALVGAGITTAAIALKDEKNRKKVKMAIENVKKMIGEKADEVEQTLSDTEEQLKEKTKAVKEIVKNRQNGKGGDK